MIGRATYGRPWIFKKKSAIFLKTGEQLKQPSVHERVELAKLHFAKSLEFKGRQVGVLKCGAISPVISKDCPISSLRD